jgi:hypothetical protein
MAWHQCARFLPTGDQFSATGIIGLTSVFNLLDQREKKEVGSK